MGSPCIPDDLYESPSGMLRARPMNAEPVHRIAGHVFVTNGGGRALFMRRDARSPWELPGGMFDPLRGVIGLVEACVISTGYGFQVQPNQRVLYTTERKQYYPEDDTWCRQTVYVYRASVTNSQPDRKLAELYGNYQIAWFHPRELKRKDVHPAFWPIVRSVARNGKAAA